MIEKIQQVRSTDIMMELFGNSSYSTVHIRKVWAVVCFIKPASINNFQIRLKISEQKVGVVKDVLYVCIKLRLSILLGRDRSE
jgi:hypothetical protein